MPIPTASTGHVCSVGRHLLTVTISPAPPCPSCGCPSLDFSTVCSLVGAGVLLSLRVPYRSCTEPYTAIIKLSAQTLTAQVCTSARRHTRKPEEGVQSTLYHVLFSSPGAESLTDQETAAEKPTVHKMTPLLPAKPALTPFLSLKQKSGFGTWMTVEGD